MKAFLSTKLGKVLLAVTVLIVVFLVVLQFNDEWKERYVLLEPILWALILAAVLWVTIDLGYGLWKRRRQANFDARMAAREGIEDRRREWAEWAAELKRQGIDRYQLPMYLLVGEPQSGKSVLLRNSDLHFPFGQNRLSGVGGTRGCDWWFTDQAVILDLAGRLFTHEGGASDEAEWAAFLEMLGDYRPQCPANGVILVLPCDGLAAEDEPEVARKAARMQAALATLTGKLQARLPVYVVLTKADKVFGFAECVHRLDAPRRHEMFGWSRPLEKLEAPFDQDEARDGFEGMVERARLLRSQMLSTARIPEALTEVDRLYAFPEELAALWPMLSLYLQRIFTESRLIDQLFFRGLYLTSGLQSGAPIAKVCAELLGTTGEADRRNLEGLFTKQRAYFIKDLIRERVFTEQGLVRPTRQRVTRARRNAWVAYGLAGASALVSVLWASVHLAHATDDKEADRIREEVEGLEQAVRSGDARSVAQEAVKLRNTHEETLLYTSAGDRLAKVSAEAIERMVLPAVAAEMAQAYADAPEPRGFADFELRLEQARLLLREEIEPDELSRVQPLAPSWEEFLAEARSTCAFPLDGAARKAVGDRAESLWAGRLDAGSGWAQPGHLGFLLAEAVLLDGSRLRRLGDSQDCRAVRRHTNALFLLLESAAACRTKDGKLEVRVGEALDELREIEAERTRFRDRANLAELDWTLATDLEERLGRERAKAHEVPRDLNDVLASEALREVCDPAFLALDPVRLPLDLARAIPEGDPLALLLFGEKRRCLEEDYLGAFSTLARLRSAFGGREVTGAFDPALSAHLGGMVRALPGDLPRWSRHVRGLVDEYERELVHAWTDERALMDTELVRHLDAVGLTVETPGRAEWLDRVVSLLVDRLGTTTPVAAGRFYGLAALPEVADYARPLRSTAQELMSGEREAAEVATLLAEARAARSTPPNGAGAFVNLLYRALCEVAFRDRIRSVFLDEFRGLVGPQGSHRRLAEALWAEQGDCSIDQLRFFDRDETLDRLCAKYRLASPGTADAPERWNLNEFSGPQRADEPAWKALGFLLELQDFLLAGDPDHRRVVSSKLVLRVRCDRSSPAFALTDPIYLYLEGGQAPAYLELDDRAAELLETTWLPASGRFLRLRWTKSPAPQPGDHVLEAHGALAPLSLAWTGTHADGDWRLERAPSGTSEKAVLTFHFENPLPVRPARLLASD